MPHTTPMARPSGGGQIPPAYSPVCHLKRSRNCTFPPTWGGKKVYFMQCSLIIWLFLLPNHSYVGRGRWKSGQRIPSSNSLQIGIKHSVRLLPSLVCDCISRWWWCPQKCPALLIINMSTWAIRTDGYKWNFTEHCVAFRKALVLVWPPYGGIQDCNNKFHIWPHGGSFAGINSSFREHRACVFESYSHETCYVMMEWRAIPNNVWN